MFDPVTAALIRTIEGLEGLDANRLPEQLTQIFTEIVAARIRLGDIPVDDNSINDAIDRFSRLANTLQPWVLLEPNRANVAGVAYVAAQSHLVVEMAISLSAERIRGHLSMDSISPSVSAMLLFLIANQPADAAGVAARINIAGQGVIPSLIRELVALAIGDIRSIDDGSAQDVLSNGKYLERAAENLYEQIRTGVRSMARQLLGQVPDPRAEPDRIFSAVIEASMHRLAAVEAMLPGEDDILLNVFSGPFQLALLMRAVWGILSKAAVVNLPPPSGIDASAWSFRMRLIIPRRPYLWPNHLSAVSGGLLDPGKSSVLTFPTGAGKSTLAELKIAATLCTSRSVLYLAPTHALVAQVKANLRALFGRESVADVLQSDEYYAETDEEARNRSVVTVMTPERCLASLGINADPFAQLGLVVFDECHLIHPRSDGQNRRSLDAMLTILNLLSEAPEADWLLISAMLANGEEIADWIAQETSRPCVSFKLEWKPTRQARGCLVFEGKDIDGLNSLLRTEEARAKRKDNGELTAPPSAVNRRLTATAHAFVCLQQTWQTKHLQNYTLVRLLKEPLLLGGTLAPQKRSWRLRAKKNEVASRVAAECAKLGMKVLVFVQQRDHTASVAKSVDEFLDQLVDPPVLDESATEMLRVATEEVGSAEDLYIDPGLRATCHHALMLPSERDFAERVFRSRNGTNVLSATPTLAQGINLPADVVLIVGETRFDKTRNRQVPIDAHEILNAAGRAGRAGHVAQGIVLVVPNYIVEYRFSDKTNTLGGSWGNLQAVFAKQDQCLEASDPVQLMLDRVQLGVSDGDVPYFLRRLPVDSAEYSERTAKILRRSFAAFRARVAKEETVFEAKLAKAIAARRAISGEETDWRAELASLAGVSVSFVVAVDDTLAAEAPPDDLMGLLEWFFRWLKRHQALLPDALGYRLVKNVDSDEEQLPLFGDRNLRATRAWMNGESLRTITDLLIPGGGGRRAKEGREFALRLIPEISFAIGIVAQVQRRRIDDGLTENEMSLALASAGLCVREGCPTPEVAALRMHFSGECRSRQELIDLSTKISPYLSVGHPTEKFGRTRRRVARALEKLAAAER